MLSVRVTWLVGSQPFRMETVPGNRAERALHVVRSTTTASLCDDLAGRIDARWRGDAHGYGRIGPWDRIVVAVQGKGLERWLRRRMTRTLGVLGGIEMPYLRRFLLDVAGLVTGDGPPAREPDDERELAYAVAREIAELCTGGSALRGPVRADAVPRADPARIAPLVSPGIDPHALLAAGHRIARIFDAIELERPELAHAWGRGQPMPAQAPWLPRSAQDRERLHELCTWMHPLWWRTAGPGRPASAERGQQLAWSGHRAWKAVRDAIAIMEDDARWEDAHARILQRAASGEGERLPEMVSVFGVSSLPPLVLHFLAALGRRTDTALHLVVPTEQLMDSAVMGRSRAEAAATPDGGTEDGDPHDGALDALAAQGQALLAACARQPMAMQALVLDASHVRDADVPAPASRAEGSALARLQLALREGVPFVPGAATPAGPDGSITVHLVSGASRAADALRDDVLDALSALPGAGPDDVLVMTTDIELYGAAIARAMQSAEPRPLPVVVADRSERIEREGVRVFSAALELADGDVPLDALRTVMASEPVAERHGVSVDDLRDCIDRLAASGARRFADPAHRAEALARVSCGAAASAAGGGAAAMRGAHRDASSADSLPDVPDGSIGEAADRVAVALATDPDAPGIGIPSLGRALDAVDSLLALVRDTARERPLEEWCAWALELVECLLPGSDSRASEAHAADRASLRAAIGAISRCARSAGLSRPLPFSAARAELLSAIDRNASGRRFGAGGGITVSGLVPMRSVPSRVIALVGLDRGAFPRRDEAGGLDPRRWSRMGGDRSPREEDRALFLEAIHAAGERLIIISSAVDPATGERQPPSPLVELLLEQCGAAVRVVRHGVHAFGEEEWVAGEFPRPRRDAHARRCAAARRRGASGAQVARPCASLGAPAVPDADALLRIDSLERIVRCMRDPAKWWLDCIGARLAPQVEAGDELEPDSLTALELHELRRSALEACMEGSPVVPGGTPSASGSATSGVAPALAARAEGERWLHAGRLPAGALGEVALRDLSQWARDALAGSDALALCPVREQEWSVALPGGQVLACASWVSSVDPSVQLLLRGGGWDRRHSVEIAIRALAWRASGGGRTLLVPAPEPSCGFDAAVDPSATAMEARDHVDALRRLVAAGAIAPLAFHPAFVIGIDLHELASANPDALAKASGQAARSLGRSRDDLSRGDHDMSALRAVARGWGTEEILAARGPSEGQAGADGPVRTDFQAVCEVLSQSLQLARWSAPTRRKGSP